MSRKTEAGKISHFDPVIRGIGNKNIISGHIERLEVEFKSSLGPNQEVDITMNTAYYCWALVSALKVAQSLEHKYIRHHSSDVILEKTRLEEMLEFFKGKLIKEELSNWHYLDSVIKLRHRLIHFGVPNLPSELTNSTFVSKVVEGDYALAEQYFTEATQILSQIPDPNVPIGRAGIIGGQHV